MAAEHCIEMNINFEQWNIIVQKGIAPFDMILNEQQTQLFYRHAEALLQWNRNINLTAITDPKEIAIKHFIDSIAPLTFLKPMQHVLDVGSGGGFPGLPLKALCPSIELILLDAVRKKTSFIQHVIRALKLKGAQAIQGRVEDLSSPEKPMSFDTVVCRAFSNLSNIFKNAWPLLSPGGKIVVWKGRVPEKEIMDFRTLFRKDLLLLEMKIHTYRLPIYDAERTLIIITKRS
jgi:16S rRNA (guanine527-N7)-methyltransferase